MKICLILITLLLSVPSTIVASELDSRITYRLDKVKKSLSDAEKQVSQGNKASAVRSLDAAQREWQKIFDYYKGKFDEGHKDIVSTKAQFEKLRKSIGSAPQNKTSRPIERRSERHRKRPSESGTKKLPASMAYNMEKIHKQIESAAKALSRQDLEAAQRAMEEAAKTWKNQLNWNAGKFDVNHPDVEKLNRSMESAMQSLAGMSNQASAMAEELPAVLDALQESFELLDATYEEARRELRSFSSLREDYESGREQDLKRVQAKMAHVGRLAHRVHALLPDVHVATTAFRTQYPDLRALDNLVKGGAEAGQALERAEAFPTKWRQELERVNRECLDRAAASIQMYGTNVLGQFRGKDPAVTTYATQNAEKWIVDYSSLLTEVVDYTFPTDVESLPGFPQKRQEFASRAQELQGEIDTVATLVSEMTKEVVDAKRRRLEQARFPASEFKGGEWADAEEAIRGAWERKIQDKTLLQVSIDAPWEQRTEARWRGSRWIVGTYKYLGAYCLAKLSSGKVMVYHMNFRRTLQSDGSWSSLEQWSVGHVYQILPENVGK